MSDENDLPNLVLASDHLGQLTRTVAQTARIVPFPMQRRVGKIRDVATKMLATKSDRHASSYRRQVTEAMLVSLRCVPAGLHAAQIVAFWRAVDREAVRIVHRSRNVPKSVDDRGE